MHLNVPIPRGWKREPRSLLQRRQGPGPGQNMVFIIIGSIAAIVLAVTVVICIRKSRKDKKKLKGIQETDKGGFLKWFQRKKGRYSQTPSEDGGESGRQSHQLDSNSTSSNNRQNRNSARNSSNVNTTINTNTAGATVDRNTSVRSVLTLPAYRPSANNNEQVLGREGERDGVDVIIDLPTAEAEEEARNEEMETMYQIRLARRQAIAEREERRERRREARQRNDYRELEAIRAETRAANEDNTISELRTTVDQLKDNRQRSVSSVSYADVGVARHDGTRIRANSSESERVGLLSDAASMQSGHQRGRSYSSAASHDDDFSSLAPARSRGASIRSGSVDGRAGSSPELVEADLGDEVMPPPEYEDIPLGDDRSSSHGPPPDYSGPERSASRRTQQTTERDLGSDWQIADAPAVDGHNSNSSHNGQGTGSAPQLPSLSIPQLPEIVIEPSSANPRDDERSPHR